MPLTSQFWLINVKLGHSPFKTQYPPIGILTMKSKDEELIDLHKTFFWQSEKIIPSADWDELDKLSEKLPADIMHVNDRDTVALTYVDPITRKIKGITQENIAIEGAATLANSVEPANLKRNIETVIDFVKRGNKNEIGVLFQLINVDKTPGSDYEWYVSFMKLSDKANGVFTLDFKIKFLDKYQNKFMKIIVLDEFVHKNMNKFQELSAREVEILSMVALGQSSNEIAEKLFISKHTVDTHRKNIMGKLSINRFVDLIRFAEAFDLV